MKKYSIILSITLLLGGVATYFISIQQKNKEVIKIPPIQIPPKQQSQKSKLPQENPKAILSKLEKAVERAATPSKEEEAQAILETLKKHTQSLQSADTPVVSKKEPLVKKEKTLKSLASKKSEKKKEKPQPKKRVVSKKKSSTKPKALHKKVAKKATKPTKKAQKQTLVKPKRVQGSKKKVTKTQQKVSKKVVKRATVENKSTTKQLSREEEVARYYQQRKDGLEIISQSAPFTLDEPIENAKEQQKYFKEFNHQKVSDSNKEPIGFVKTLGVVEVSQPYEVKEVIIPKKVELAQEGIVDISSASVETEELKSLKFVEPLEVVEVTPAFETIEADKYIK